MIDQISALEIIAPIDRLFAERLFARYKSKSTPNPRSVLFLALLMALNRLGHVCLPLDPQKLRLLLDPLCIKAPELTADLVASAIEGVHHLPQELFTSLEDQTLPMKPICISSSHAYLQKNWLYESEVLFHLKRLKASTVNFTFSQPAALENLNPEQQRAVINGMNNPLSFMTGGPGTGKTYTAAHLVRQCMMNLSPQQQSQFRVILAAPTGKAVAHLEKNMHRFLSDLHIPHLKTGTLHALLEIKSDRARELAPPALLADLILIDECSMIDAPLFARLCQAVVNGARLVLIGDPDQLPPVEAGSFFADLIDTDLFPTTRLKQSLRMEQQEILGLASAIQQADIKTVITALMEQESRVVFKVDLQMKRGSEAKFALLLAEYVEQKFPRATAHPPDPQMLFSLNEQFRILSCMRQGPFGVDAINQILLQRALHTCFAEGWLAVPIMITRNDYTMQLYNGDTGFLIKRMVSNEKVRKIGALDYALFLDKKQGIRTLPALALSAFDYAYSLSVHQSQGSEYDEILLLVPEGSETFGRQVLYTAVTRAKRSIAWEGQLPVIQAAVNKSSRKQSGLTPLTER
ncbi:MAG: exodeoxyribonuclease V subunit alpha [Rhabdochlamydiaceae bacterium]|nr:exodeoxyribonuclease V subunit alpha [Rhabdochlamydiaceae bacterium]